MTYCAIIPAAGSAQRMQLGYNKILIPYKGKPLIWTTLKPFLEDRHCTTIFLVIQPNEEMLLKHLLEFTKVRFVNGGASRQESVYNGLRHVTSEWVLIHDGARPFVSGKLIQNVLTKLETHSSVIPALPLLPNEKVPDRIWTDDKGQAYKIQTPQGFHTALAQQAYQQAVKNQVLHQFRDDASLIEHFSHVSPLLILGESSNIKITQPEDLKKLKEV